MNTSNELNIKSSGDPTNQDGVLEEEFVNEPVYGSWIQV